jgi:hypothetical protein
LLQKVAETGELGWIFQQLGDLLHGLGAGEEQGAGGLGDP